MTCDDCYSYPCEKVGTACYNAIRKAERDKWDKAMDRLEQLLCAHHKYVGSYRVITGTSEEIYDELFSAMQEIRQKEGE